MKMPNITIIVLWILISVTGIKSARILVIAHFPFRSHFSYSHAVSKTLIKAGHEITVVTPFPNESAKENFTSIIDSSDGEFIYISQSSIEPYLGLPLYEWFNVFKDIQLPLCERVFKLKELQVKMHQSRRVFIQLIPHYVILKALLNSKEKKFDIIIVTLFQHHKCFYRIAEKFNIPIIGLMSQRSWIVPELEISNPRHPLIVPMELRSDVNPRDFIYRISSVIDYCRYVYYSHTIMDFFEPINIKPSLIFINSHSSYFPRPMNPNMIEIGGIHIEENKPLPQNIQKFLDEAQHGAILFTLGSVARTAVAPKHKIQAFKEAFAEIPQRIIWKYEEEMEVSNNVMLMKWLPQKEILAHNNVKAFISHCGQGAIHESLYYGVPLISCPMIVDQQVNARIFENLEIAVPLNYENLTKENVLQALKEIITNTKYYEKMQDFSHKFKDRPMTPQQTVVYWTEYVVRHKGAPHLRSPAAELNWFQYFLLDVIGFIILVLASISYISYKICKLTYSSIRSYCKKIAKSKRQ